MPPNEVTVDEAKPASEVESATPELETADQKAEEATQHSVFRENEHHQVVESQKIMPNIEEIKTTASSLGTTEGEAGLYHSPPKKKKVATTLSHFSTSLLCLWPWQKRPPPKRQYYKKSNMLVNVLPLQLLIKLEYPRGEWSPSSYWYSWLYSASYSSVCEDS